MGDNITKQITKFDGTDSTIFQRYSTKLLAVGALKSGFDQALEQDLNISTTFNQVHTQAIQEENVKKRRIAWRYLLLTLEEEPLLLVEETATRNPFNAWVQLNATYMSTLTDMYTKMTTKLESLVMLDPFKDPNPWMHQIAVLNFCLQRISASYAWDDLQLVLHILHKLLKETYRAFVSYHKMQGYNGITVKNFKKRVREHWRSKVWTREDGIQVAMTVSNVPMTNDSVNRNQQQMASEIMKKLKAMMMQHSPSNTTQGIQSI